MFAFKKVAVFFVFACIIISLAYFRNNRDDIEKIYPEKTIRVKITGEVVRPGVYVLYEGSNVGDLLSLAGGFLLKGKNENLDLERELSNGEILSIGTGM
ncbi:MAG: SLBB domain-containing protein [Leptospiraceae bacterium]|nr:SLBB domain-containing protein [Leptospiraceae bacterium]